MLKRPIVLCSTIFFINASLILRFTASFTLILTLSLVACVLFSFFLLRAHKGVLLFLFIPTIVMSVIIPHISFLRNEARANSFLDVYGTKTRYTAVIEDCKIYTSYSLITADITSADGDKISKPIKVRIGCYSSLQLQNGDKLTFEGTPRSVYDIENDGFDTQSFLRSKRIFIDFPSINVISSSASEKISFFSRLKNHTKHVFYKFIPSFSNYNTSSLCDAMFAGDKSLIPKNIKDAFTECGLTHLLCVSGMHLAVVSGACLFMLSLLSVHKKIKCFAVIAICIFYTAFTGFSLSTLRACIMCILGFTGLILGRKTDAYISLFFSLFVICIFSPYSVMDISLILSFCATLGIICLSEFVAHYREKSKTTRFISSVLYAFAVNLGAVIFTLPICAASFGGISILSVISTLTVSFIFQILLCLLLFLVTVSPLSNIAFLAFIPDVAGKLCGMLSGIIIKIAEFFSQFRYATVTAHYSELFVLLFMVCVLAVSIFICFDSKKGRLLCTSAVIILSVVFSCLCLYLSIIDDGIYKISYYRKNENDRQLSIKLGYDGYLLVNADSNLCFDKDDLPFDSKQGKNHLLIIPDNNIEVSVLSDEIEIFRNRFGLENVYVPQGSEGTLLAKELLTEGVECLYLPRESTVGSLKINYIFDDSLFLVADDGKTSTAILFGEDYNEKYFDKEYNICAYFTRKTKNQFNINKDKKPECAEFITRLGKDITYDGITNTFSEKSVTVKG